MKLPQSVIEPFNYHGIPKLEVKPRLIFHLELDRETIERMLDDLDLIRQKIREQYKS